MNVCKICGFVNKKELSGGDICSCCFNEIGFDDEKTKEEVLGEFCNNDSELMYEIAPEIREYEDEDYLSSDTVNKFLRLIWIQNGCRHYENPLNWNKSKGIEQLKNINIAYELLFEEYALRLAKIDPFRE